MAAPDYAMFSSDVRLTLNAAGKSFDLASIGPNDVVPRDAIDLPRCDAEVVMDVDGDRLVWAVRLPNGAVPFDKTIKTIAAGGPTRSASPR